MSAVDSENRPTEPGRAHTRFARARSMAKPLLCCVARLAAKLTLLLGLLLACWELLGVRSERSKGVVMPVVTVCSGLLRIRGHVWGVNAIRRHEIRCEGASAVEVDLRIGLAHFWDRSDDQVDVSIPAPAGCLQPEELSFVGGRRSAVTVECK